jgi:hypothetical protein
MSIRHQKKERDDKIGKLMSNLPPEGQILARDMLETLTGKNKGKTTQIFDFKTCLCGKKSTKLCSNCHLIFYCSRQCEKDDYKKHKKICQDFRTIEKENRLTYDKLEESSLSDMRDVLKLNNKPEKKCYLCENDKELKIFEGGIFCNNCLEIQISCLE